MNKSPAKAEKCKSFLQIKKHIHFVETEDSWLCTLFSQAIKVSDLNSNSLLRFEAYKNTASCSFDLEITIN